MHPTTMPTGTSVRIAYRSIPFVLFIVILCFISFSVVADDQTATPPGSVASVEPKKIALVIGNKDYQDAPLRTPADDAMDISQALNRMGFSVITKTDVNRNDFEAVMDEFSREIADAQVALFYFSGYGCQVNGENYLVPVGDTFSSDEDLRSKAVNAGYVLDKMGKVKNRINIIILDACRDNPFKGIGSPGRGLAPLEAPAGFFIAYAAAPGTVSSDGQDRNSIYTKYLLRAIETKGLAIEPAFKMVLRDVRKETQDQQAPWTLSSLSEDFSFNPPPAAATGTPTVSPPSHPSPDFRVKAEQLLQRLFDDENPPGEELQRIAGDPEAANWFLQAAEKGDPVAQLMVGVMLVPGNQRGALRWFRKAADQGNAVAQTMLGLSYFTGEFGNAKDYREAMKWYRKAVDQGYATAQKFLCDAAAVKNLDALSRAMERLANEAVDLNLRPDIVAEAMIGQKALKYIVGPYYGWAGCDKKCKVLIRYVPRDGVFVPEGVSLVGRRIMGRLVSYSLPMPFQPDGASAVVQTEISDAGDGDPLHWNSYPVGDADLCYTESVIDQKAHGVRLRRPQGIPCSDLRKDSPQ